MSGNETFSASIVGSVWTTSFLIILSPMIWRRTYWSTNREEGRMFNDDRQRHDTVTIFHQINNEWRPSDSSLQSTFSSMFHPRNSSNSSSLEQTNKVDLNTNLNVSFDKKSFPFRSSPLNYKRHKWSDIPPADKTVAWQTRLALYYWEHRLPGAWRTWVKQNLIQQSLDLLVDHPLIGIE